MKTGAGDWGPGAGRRRPVFAGAVLALVTALPQIAVACPVCFSNGNPRVLEAYYISVACMSALPLAMIGGVGWWLYTAVRRGRQEEDRSEKPGARSQQLAEGGVLPLAPTS